MTSNIKGMTQSLSVLRDLLSFFQTETIKIPGQYREKVIQTKKLLECDTSGLVNSILDFGVNCSLVNYSIETNNNNLTELLNNWLKEVNSEYRGKLPTGIKALAKEYFRERWKGSSNLVLRSFWDKKYDMNLPTAMFFVDGEDIVIERKDLKKITLGDEKYYIRIDNDKENNIPIPKETNEILFTQKPYEYWGAITTVPYIIRKGLFKNLKFLTLMSSKGEYIVGRALEYLFLIKKGTERLALDGRPEFTYSPEDLKKVTEDFSSLLDDKKNISGTPTYTANFDTEIEHMIPDYQKALHEDLYAPIERKILAGLGIVDIITGTSSTRRESLLNPKPFISEIKQGIEDFKTLLTDILYTIAEKNKEHIKYFSGKSVKLEVHSSPVEHFIDDKLRDHIRSMYDRGTISIETYNSTVGVGYIEHKVEINRRKMEANEKLEDLMYPHLIDNVEGRGDKDVPGIPLNKKPSKVPVGEKPNPKDKKIIDEKIPGDKKSIEKKNYRGSLDKCSKCGYEFDYYEAKEEEVEYILCPGCGETLDQDKIYFATVFEQAPYTNDNYPSQLKNLPKGARNIWIKTFNSVLSETKNEDQARQAAWYQVKSKYKKINNKWVLKNKG